MKIVVLDGYALNPGDLSWDGFKNIGEIDIYDRTESHSIIDRAKGAEILLTNKTPLSAETLKALPEVKYIGVLATGYNVVDTKAAKEAGIVVTNIPEYGTKTVAQYVFAMLLEICHRVGEHNDSVKSGEWQTSKDFSYWNHPLIELAGKKMGIIGTGKIGVATANIAKAFGMEVLAYDPYPNQELIDDNFRYVELEELYKEADVISLHCPLFDSTLGMINKSAIDSMKDGVIIINTSRGPLIVEEDLREGLESGKVYGVALDVLKEEPPREGSVLFNIPNCIVTPHIAWATKEARGRLMNTAVENLEKFLIGDVINKVN